MKPIFNAFSDLHRSLERYDCNRLCKLLIECLMFNLLFVNKAKDSGNNNHQKDSKSGLSYSTNLGKSVSGYHNHNNNNRLIRSQNTTPVVKMSSSHLKSSNLSQPEYTIILDLDETMVHYFFVSD